MNQSNALNRLFSRVNLPNNVKDAWRHSLTSDSCFVAGGTLLQAKWEMEAPIPECLISLESIDGFRGIGLVIIDGAEYVKIGALTPLSDCLVDPLIFDRAPLLQEACRNIAAPAIRNRGTLGGNVAGKIGDSLPVLLVLESKLILYNDDGYYMIPIIDWLQSNHSNLDLICSILIPSAPLEHSVQTFFRKIGRREAFTSTVVTTSACFEKTKTNRIKDIRLAVGGGQHTPMRLFDSETLLEGALVNPELIESIHPVIFSEIQSYTDVFASESYRKMVAANLLVSFLKGDGIDVAR